MTMPRNSLLVTLVSCLLLISGCSDNSAATPPPSARPLSVSVQALAPRGAYTVEQRFAGRVEVAQNSALGFETGGKLEQVLVDEGSQVLADQILARLDTRLLQAEAKRLQAQRHEVRARLHLARTSLERLIALERKGYASTQNRDELQAEVDALQASIAVIDSTLASNQLLQDKSLLRAPFAARIGRRLADEGEVLATGQPVLQLLAESNTEFNIGIPPERAAVLRPDREYSVQIGNRQVPARLLSIGADLNPGSRTLPVRLAPVEPIPLVNGALAQLWLPQTYPADGFEVPLSALTDGVRGLWNVYVVRDSDAGSRVEVRDVRVLHSTTHSAYITGAVQPGEQIITRGLHRIVPGQRVSPQPETAGAQR